MMDHATVSNIFLPEKFGTPAESTRTQEEVGFLFHPPGNRVEPDPCFKDALSLPSVISGF
jgi:hypothetical protein